jgi:hypothetical protein
MNNIRKNLSNAIGWRTRRKIVVIESDDWGSIRTKSKKDFDFMLAKGLDIAKSNFTANDCLESNNDLENLFELLYKHKDSKGRSAVFTPMCIMANPDFEKIKASDFRKYYYESFTETCKKYNNHNKVHDLWVEGLMKKLFVPALHGREHLNVSRWMKALQNGNKGLLIAFDHQSIGATSFKGQGIPEYLGAFHPDFSTDIPRLKQIIESGVDMFQKIYGYTPTHFIAPNKEGPKEIDVKLAKMGVKYLTMSKLRRYPIGNGKYKREYNWLGKKNESGQIFITRNCGFEPSDPSITDWVSHCLAEIDIAFKWRKPAIISSHRVNYVGFIKMENASNGLLKLDHLLTSIKKHWPDVEFMSSMELGDLISSANRG